MSTANSTANAPLSPWEWLGELADYPTDRAGFESAHGEWALTDDRTVFALYGSYALACALAATVFRNRPALPLPRAVFVAHNAFQALLSLFMTVGVAASARCAGYSLAGNRIFDPTRAGGCEQGVVFFVRLFVLSKAYDLVDTLLLVLAKKPFSMLHCSHHAVVPVALHFGMRYSPAGDSYMPVMVNAFVHFVLYSYYLCCTLRVRFPWKHLITRLQLAQFLVLLAFGVNCWRVGSIAPETSLINTAIQAWMLVGFGRLYAEKYRGSGKGKRE